MVTAFIFNCFLLHSILKTITSVTYICLSNSTCGCSLYPSIITKIIGGEEAPIDSWGWAVSIRLGRSHICGGSLISPELVLTAAHCLVSVNKISSLSVTAGSNYLSIINQQRSVSQIFIHRYFNARTYVNDIAILRLSSSFDMSDRSLALICLSKLTSEYAPDNTSVIAIGWGALSTTEKTHPDALYQVTLQIVASTSSICSLSIYDEKNQFCAGSQSGGKDTCQGDSGGPIMVFSNHQWYIIGITSYGTGCALPYYPGVYTNVSVYEEELTCLLNNETLCIVKNFIERNSVSTIFSHKYFIFVFYCFLIHADF